MAEAIDDVVGSTEAAESDRVNAALAAYSTPVHPPAHLVLTPDERAELEQFCTMLGRLHLGLTTFDSTLGSPTLF